MEETNSYVDETDDLEPPSNPGEPHPRIPPETSGIQYNFCKNLKCSQFKLIPDNQKKVRGVKLPYSFISGGKHYPLLKCNVCWEAPPIKSNLGIVSEINRISAYLKPKDIISCPHQACANHTIQVGTRGAYHSSGKTAAGSKRFQCQNCKKTFSISRLTQYQHETHNNIIIFKLLVNKNPLSRIIEILEITWEVLYNRIDFIHKQCLAFVAHRELQLKSLPIEKLYLSVDRQDYVVNWAKRKDKRNIVISAVATVDNSTGYVFGIHPNFDPTINREEIESDAASCGDNKLPPPYRKYAQYWLASDYRASLEKNNNAAQQIGNQLFDQIEITYEEAVNREDDVEVFDRKYLEEKLPDYGMQVHTEYTLIAHFYFLKRLLGNVQKWRFSLDQESGIRAAFISAFHEEIVAHTAEGFYVRIEKGLTIEQKRRWVNDALIELKILSKEYPGLTENQVKLILLKKNIAAGQALGHWKDRWVNHPIPTICEANKAMCWLTAHDTFDDDHIAWLYNKASLHGVDSFFAKIRRRVSILERSMHSAANAGRTWTGYAAYNPHNVIKMVEIFRVVHNYVDVRKKEKTTAAMRLGLAQAKIKYKDILYFEK